MMARSDSFKKWLAGLMALGLLVFFGFRVVGPKPSVQFQEKPGMKAPGFTFQERAGREFSSDELKGKVWVADFIFTTCAGSCPLLSQKMKRLQGIWKGNPGFKLVTFTVDPERDTVVVMRQYAKELGADENQWFFLTGAKKDLFYAAREGFKVAAEPDPTAGLGYDFVHTTYMVLVDAQGNIRGYYDGQQEQDLTHLDQDIRYLMAQKG